MCCLLILPPTSFYFISHLLLKHLELFSSTSCVSSTLGRKQAVLSDTESVKASAGLHLCGPQTSTQHFSTATCVGALQATGGPLRPLLSCASPLPLCPPRTSQNTHMVLIEAEEASAGYGERKARRVTVASKFYNRAVTLFSGICSPVAQQAGNNGMGDGGSRERGGASLSLPLFFSLSDSFSRCRGLKGRRIHLSSLSRWNFFPFSFPF